MLISSNQALVFLTLPEQDGFILQGRMSMPKMILS